MKISALASLLGVAATTLLPGVSASESEVSVVPISPLCRTLCCFMSDFMLLSVYVFHDKY